MNNEDKEAFEKWNKLPVDQMLTPLEYREFLRNMYEYDFTKKAWEAACEYKDAQLINGTEMKQMNDRIKSLLEENAILSKEVKTYRKKLAERDL